MSAFLSCQNVAHFMLYCLKLFEQKGMSNYEVFSTTIELLTECFHKKRNNKAWIFAKIPIGIHEKFRRQLFLTKKPKTKNGINKTIISWLGQNIPTFQISKIIWNMQVHMFQTLSTRWQKDTLTACVLFLAKNPTTYTLLAQLAHEESGSGFDAKYYQKTLFLL